MAKLVLDIEPSLINTIKDVVEKKNISLSEWTENLYRKATEGIAPTEKGKEETILINEDLPEWIKELTLSKKPIPDFDAKKEYGDHIVRKYGL